jgi:hypothetical protein
MDPMVHPPHGVVWYDNSFVNIDGQMIESVSGGGHFGGGIFITHSTRQDLAYCF